MAEELEYGDPIWGVDRGPSDIAHLKKYVGRLYRQIQPLKHTSKGICPQHREEAHQDIFKWWDKVDVKLKSLAREIHEVTARDINQRAVDREDMLNEMKKEIEESESRSQLKLKNYYDTAVDDVHAKLLSQMEDQKGDLLKQIGDQKGELTAMRSEVQDMEELKDAKLLSLMEDQKGEMATLEARIGDLESKLTGTPLAPSGSVRPPAAMPIVPLMPPIARHMTSVKWTKGLSKLRHKEVRSFVLMFRSFRNASGMSEEELKLTLLQSLDGEALQLVSPIAELSTVTEILERLLNRVRPSESVLVKKLMETKQRIRESIYDFCARFQLIASELTTYADSRIRDMLIESLNETWRMTSRSLVMSDPMISVEELTRKLMESEGTDVADRMEVDHMTVPKSPQYEEYREPHEVAQVVIDGRINWDEVRDPRTLTFAWKQLMRSDRVFRNQCMSWINQKPSYPNAQQNGFRPPQGNRARQYPPNRRIFNVKKLQGPECECEVCEDDLFEETSQACAVTKIADKGHVQVIH